MWKGKKVEKRKKKKKREGMKRKKGDFVIMIKR